MLAKILSKLICAMYEPEVKICHFMWLHIFKYILQHHILCL